MDRKGHRAGERDVDNERGGRLDLAASSLGGLQLSWRRDVDIDRVIVLNRVLGGKDAAAQRRIGLVLVGKRYRKLLVALQQRIVIHVDDCSLQRFVRQEIDCAVNDSGIVVVCGHSTDV